MEKQWTKFRKYSDWGKIYVAPEGTGIRNGHTSVTFGSNFGEGQVVEIRWPDGKEETCMITMQPKTEVVSGVGHAYDVESDVPGVMRDMNGALVWVCVDEFEVLW